MDFSSSSCIITDEYGDPLFKGNCLERVHNSTLELIRYNPKLKLYAKYLHINDEFVQSINEFFSFKHLIEINNTDPHNIFIENLITKEDIRAGNKFNIVAALRLLREFNDLPSALRVSLTSNLNYTLWDGGGSLDKQVKYLLNTNAGGNIIEYILNFQSRQSIFSFFLNNIDKLYELGKSIPQAFKNDGPISFTYDLLRNRANLNKVIDLLVSNGIKNISVEFRIPSDTGNTFELRPYHKIDNINLEMFKQQPKEDEK